MTSSICLTYKFCHNKEYIDEEPKLNGKQPSSKHINQVRK